MYIRVQRNNWPSIAIRKIHCEDMKGLLLGLCAIVAVSSAQEVMMMYQPMEGEAYEAMMRELAARERARQESMYRGTYDGIRL